MSVKERKYIADEMSEKIIATAKRIAFSEGAEAVNVRRVLKELKVTNRVFYNRFSNMEEVLGLIYESTVLKIRESINVTLDPRGDFFSQVTEIAGNTLTMSYKSKNNLSQYVFEHDSLMDANCAWWEGEIKRLIEFGKAEGYLADIDSEVISHAIWCFIRGYNADAVARNIPVEKALADFRYSFGILLRGMKK